MTNELIVTAIVPNYNHARFLDKRLQSVFNQTYPWLQVIILDDCSTDDSRLIIEKYRNHPRTKAIVYNEINTGSPFLQWKKGVDLADTEWIWIAESDDYCELNFLETLECGLKSEDCVMAISMLQWVNEAGENLRNADLLPQGFIRGADFFRNYMLSVNCLQNAGMIVFRREVSIKVESDWTLMKQAGDYFFWSSITLFGTIYSSGIISSFFVRHRLSLSKQFALTETEIGEVNYTIQNMHLHNQINRNDVANFLECKLNNLFRWKKMVGFFQFYRLLFCYKQFASYQNIRLRYYHFFIWLGWLFNRRYFFNLGTKLKV